MTDETPKQSSRPALPEYKTEYYIDANGKKRKKIKKLVKKDKELTEE